MEISLDPVIFYIGSYGVRWYTAIELLSIAAGFALFACEAKRKGMPIKHVWFIFFLAVVSAFLMARLLEITERWDLYEMNAAMIFSPAGARINGVLIGGFIMTLIYSRISGLSFWQINDTAMPGALLFMAGIRIGCIVNGCCYGLPCDTAFGVIYLNPHSLAPQGVPLYPTQFLHAVWSFSVFGMIWLLRKRLQSAGSVYLLSLILYVAGDFIIRFWRDNESILLGVTVVQMVDLGIFLAAAVAYGIRQR